MNYRILCVLLYCSIGSTSALLYPQDSETRETRTLDGIWNFRLTPRDADADVGFKEEWFLAPLASKASKDEVIPMPVPSSYNDITQDKNVRDFVGWAWYDRTFFVPASWKSSSGSSSSDRRVVLRVGSASHTARIYVNGHLATEQHQGGHLPFEADVSPLLNFWEENRVTIAVNNTLTLHTIPQGKFNWREESDHYPKGFFELDYEFDFFNYAGIHRPVTLYSTPRRLYVKDVSVSTVSVSADLKSATLAYAVEKYEETQVDGDASTCVVTLYDAGGVKVGEGVGPSGSITLQDPNLWWPHLTHDNPGYLYTARVWVSSLHNGEDIYRLKVGIRSVEWNSSGIFINHRPFYFRGFGKHEDSDIRGKGLDLPLVAKDFNLIEWVGANSFRTSHYPYAEEIMDFADSRGIVVIDECPAVAIDNFGSAELLENHKRSLTELISRDKNRPSVVMWSIANEPRSSKHQGAEEYFGHVASHVRSLDPTRPVTVVVNSDPDLDRAVQHVDIVGLNRYFGWYEDTGRTELIARQMTHDIERWKARFPDKPIMVTEYGADTIAGFHQSPPHVFTEEYQVELMARNFEAFDVLRKKGLLIGEMIWNFADFMTKQTYGRALGNRKGIFTRQRQPKMSAHLLRKRYWGLAREEEVESGSSNSSSSAIASAAVSASSSAAAAAAISLCWP